MLSPGLYEQIINNKIHDKLEVAKGSISQVSSIDEAEAHKILSHYLLDIIEKSLLNISDVGGGIGKQIMMNFSVSLRQI